MSLQIWLPLDGSDLNNRGVASSTISTSSLTYASSGGKINSKCQNGGTINIFSQMTSSIHSGLSISVWWKISDGNNFSIKVPAYNGANAGEITISRMDYTSSYAAKWFFTGNIPQLIWLYDTRHSNGVWELNTWHHFCWTVANKEEKTHVRAYIDGKKVADATTAYQFTLLPGTTVLSGTALANDFRVYNHCLSDKEVRLLSQGLIAHFALRDSEIEATTNLATYPTPGKNITASYDWDQTLHSNAISVSGWGVGYNKDVSTPGTGYHAHWQIIEGIPTMVFPNLNSLYSSKGRWLGISGSSGLQDDIGAKGIYTVSFDARSSVDGMTMQSGFYYRITGGTSNAFHDGKKDFILSTQWKRYSYTCTTLDTINTSVKGSFYFYGHYGIEGISYVRNIQIELNDHATAYTLNSRTPVATDCSGYSHNGTIIGKLTVSEDSARNNLSTVFNGSSAIACGRHAMVTDALTISMWAYMADWSKFNGMRLASCTESGGWNFENVGHFICYSNGTYQRASGTFASLSAGWHMITGTYDGKQAKIYIDGILKASSTALSSKYPITYNANNGIFIGAEAGGNTTTPAGNYFTGQLSDFRIYATALPEDQILNLYQARISMTNLGDAMCYEFKEDGPTNLKFTETGIIRAGGIGEIGPIYDMKIKTLNDGSAWARINWLNVAQDKTVFANAAEVAECTTATNRYSRMGIVDKFVGKKFQIVNLMPAINTTNYTGGVVSTAYKKHSSSSLQVTATADNNEVYLKTAGTVEYIPGHTYYARVELLQETIQGSHDWYWKIAEPYLYSAKKVTTAKTWTMVSGIRTAATIINRNGADWAAGSYQVRLDYNNNKTAGSMWFDGMMLIDLTATFGEGNEPTAAWCDVNIPYFTGSKMIEINDDNIGYYEFMLTYPSLSSTLYNRWRQSNSPNVAANQGTGYQAITTAWSNYAAPLTKSASSTSAVYSTNLTNNWWSPVGQLTLFQSTGIPAANGSTQTEMELWVRIDTLPSLTKLSMFDNKYIQASNIYEF